MSMLQGLQCDQKTQYSLFIIARIQKGDAAAETYNVQFVSAFVLHVKQLLAVK